MISVFCGEWHPAKIGCGKELTSPGALLFGVPRADGSVQKIHFCASCFDHICDLAAREKMTKTLTGVVEQRDFEWTSELVMSLSKIGQRVFYKLGPPMVPASLRRFFETYEAEQRSEFLKTTLLSEYLEALHKKKRGA